MGFERCFGTLVLDLGGCAEAPDYCCRKHRVHASPNSRFAQMKLQRRTEAASLAHAKRPPRERLSCVLGMLSSLEVKVLRPT